jgi:hypothetical protein
MSEHQFTTLRTAEILDALTDAIDTIRASTAVYNAPWMKALDKAWDAILQLDTVEYDVAARAWRVESGSEPGTFYTANGDCQCAAFTKGAGICYHRAGARLIARALELRALAAELVAHAHEDGETWYGEHEACIGAKWRIGELMGVASEWDAGAQGAHARIGGAQARAMAQAA